MSGTGHPETFQDRGRAVYTIAMTVSLPRKRGVLLSAAATALCLVPVAAQAAPAPGWTTPDCSVISGDGAFSYTADDGATIAATATAITPQAYSHLAALDRRDALVGVTKNTIQISRDAGCSWATIAKPRNLSQYDVTAAGKDVAYVYGINDQPIFRVAGDRVQERSGPIADDGVAGLAADDRHPNRLVAVDKHAQVYRSTDGATSWQPVGKVPDADVYQAAIDPSDLNHIVIGTSSNATYTTFDGGWRWTQSRGIGTRSHANVFSVAISPNDPSTVWVEGYDLSQSNNGARHIWRSVDGGLHYWPVLDGNDVTLYNGTPLWPSPTDPDVLYFMFGTYFGNYGTDLYRYDDARESVTWTHDHYDGIDSLVFSPADPSVMYLGLSEVHVD
jgi:photosystem II stability/assembly factor-like uncharacterized protein